MVNATGKNRCVVSLLQMTASMIIFGSIGLVVRRIDLPSGMIALVRGLTGTLFLLLTQLCTGRRPSLSSLRKNAGPLLISGTAIGFNWILLFEAYRYTTIATTTVCYYTAPIFVILLSPLVLHERLTSARALCAAVSLVGMALVTQVIPNGFGGDLRGVTLALSAAVLYASVMMTNRFLKEISALDSTVAQLGIAALVLLPYICLTGQFPTVFPTAAFWPLLIAGVVHTGIAYLLYFSAMQGLSAQSIALCSYIDPITAVLFSTLLLGEPMTALQAAGTLLILSATLLGQFRKQTKERSIHEHSENL